MRLRFFIEDVKGVVAVWLVNVAHAALSVSPGQGGQTGSRRGPDLLGEVPALATLLDVPKTPPPPGPFMTLGTPALGSSITPPVVRPGQKMYFSANCTWRMSKAVPRWKPAPPEKSRICPKFGLDGVGLFPPQFMFGLPSAGWLRMLNPSTRN